MSTSPDIDLSGVEAAILAARLAVTDDEWKQHILDGTAHLNRAYAEAYTEYKMQARAAEAARDAVVKVRKLCERAKAEPAGLGMVWIDSVLALLPTPDDTTPPDRAVL